MIAPSRQRTIRVSFASIDWFLLIDYLKLTTATFLLCIMGCILREDMAWRNAINSTKSSIVQNTEFTERMTLYASIGEEWGSLIELIGTAERIVQLVDNSKNVPLLWDAFGLVMPGGPELIENAYKLCRQLVTLKQDADFLLVTDVAVNATDIFQQAPDKQALIHLSLSYQEIGVDLQSISEKLQNILFVTQQIDKPFSEAILFLEEVSKRQVWGFSFKETVQPLLDLLKRGVTTANQISDKVAYYQSITQHDAALIHTIIERTHQARKIEVSFGMGIWRRLMNYVNRNSLLFMWANIALLVAEICLFIENRNMSRLKST